METTLFWMASRNWRRKIETILFRGYKGVVGVTWGGVICKMLGVLF